jgi:beta-galactosidase
MMMNLLNYGATYKQEFRATAVAAGSDAQLLKAVDATGLQYSKATDALAAISQPNIKLAIVAATSANLKQLISNKAKLDAFMQRGGYVVFHGLSAQSLEDYNKVVGYNHMIRPMRRERLTFPQSKTR